MGRYDVKGRMSDDIGFSEKNGHDCGEYIF